MVIMPMEPMTLSQLDQYCAVRKQDQIQEEIRDLYTRVRNNYHPGQTKLYLKAVAYPTTTTWFVSIKTELERLFPDFTVLIEGNMICLVRKEIPNCPYDAVGAFDHGC